MTERNLASPVIIRPKHAPMMRLRAVYDCLNADPDCTFCGDGCSQCAFQEDPDGCGAMGGDCLDDHYHYEHAEGGKHDKG